MKKKSQLTREQKQARTIQIVAASVIAIVILAFFASLAFGTPSASPTVTADACNPNGYGTITSGTPVLYQGQVLAWLSVTDGYIEASVDNGAPYRINQTPMVDGNQVSLTIELVRRDGVTLGTTELEGYMCGGMFYFTTPIEFYPSQNALVPTHETIV